ncbi:hypothetical protein ACOME3_004271 [Neoechinorhynchus agilis]
MSSKELVSDQSLRLRSVAEVNDTDTLEKGRVSDILHIEKFNDGDFSPIDFDEMDNRVAPLISIVKVHKTSPSEPTADNIGQNLFWEDLDIDDDLSFLESIFSGKKRRSNVQKGEDDKTDTEKFYSEIDENISEQNVDLEKKDDKIVELRNSIDQEKDFQMRERKRLSDGTPKDKTKLVELSCEEMIEYLNAQLIEVGITLDSFLLDLCQISNDFLSSSVADILYKDSKWTESSMVTRKAYKKNAYSTFRLFMLSCGIQVERIFNTLAGQDVPIPDTEFYLRDGNTALLKLTDPSSSKPLSRVLYILSRLCNSIDNIMKEIDERLKFANLYCEKANMKPSLALDKYQQPKFTVFPTTDTNEMFYFDFEAQKSEITIEPKFKLGKEETEIKINDEQCFVRFGLFVPSGITKTEIDVERFPVLTAENYHRLFHDNSERLSSVYDVNYTTDRLQAATILIPCEGILGEVVSTKSEQLFLRILINHPNKSSLIGPDIKLENGMDIVASRIEEIKEKASRYRSMPSSFDREISRLSSRRKDDENSEMILKTSTCEDIPVIEASFQHSNPCGRNDIKYYAGTVKYILGQFQCVLIRTFPLNKMTTKCPNNEIQQELAISKEAQTDNQQVKVLVDFNEPSALSSQLISCSEEAPTKWMPRAQLSILCTKDDISTMQDISPTYTRFNLDFVLLLDLFWDPDIKIEMKASTITIKNLVDKEIRETESPIAFSERVPTDILDDLSSSIKSLTAFSIPFEKPERNKVDEGTNFHHI